MNLTLKVGDKYHIRDWFGMMGYEGTYLGVVKDEANYCPVYILAFSFIPPYGKADIRYAGCIAQVSTFLSHEGVEVSTYFQAAYYGDSIETLAHVVNEQKPRRWELKK